MASNLTHTEENYLKAIYKINENTIDSVHTNAIAKHMNTTPASVTDMMKKLHNKGLIEYQKYRGAKLSYQGQVIATQLIRKHRLWETFLVDSLDFSWEEVHDIAEQLEHVDSDKLIEKLNTFLGKPKFDPHGDPIPNAEGRFTIRAQESLTNLSPGDRGVLVGVKNHETNFLGHLNNLNIRIGTTIKVLNKVSYDNSIQIEINESKTVSLSNKSGENLLIKRTI